MITSNPSPLLTIVTPTFEKHFGHFANLLASIDTHCADPQLIVLNVVVERKNVAAITAMLARHPRLASMVITTEDVYTGLGINSTPAAFLTDAGKFTFQSIKKIGGILAAQTDWVLVLDSESLFLNDFSSRELLESYTSCKYVFYTDVASRGPQWSGSLSEAVTVNASQLVGGDADRWYMEYYHWFYETAIWRDLIGHIKHNGGFSVWVAHALPMGVFENVLYYQYVATRPTLGYTFFDTVKVLEQLIEPDLAARCSRALKGSMQIVGLAEHLLRLVSADEIAKLAPFFREFKLPFVRLESDVLDPAILDRVKELPEVKALTSSHRLGIMRKRVAVCVSGEFRSVFANIQSLRQFTTGVACDIFVHAWNDDTVPAIKDALTPRGLVIENQPDFTGLQSEIVHPEPHAKENRDAGSLAMFYGIQKSIELVKPLAADYDFVVRVRPDIAHQQSLRELLFDIINLEEEAADTVYVPDSFHSQGLNDQLAIGSAEAMLRYGGIFDFAVAHAASTYFNPEHLMAAHVLEAGLEIVALPVHYLLLRTEPANFDHVGHLLHHQNATWWSAPLPGPRLPRRATGFFAAKRAAMEAIAAAQGFEASTIIIDPAFFSPAARQRLAGRMPVVTLEREYKNPAVDLIAHGIGPDDATLFIDVRPDGLHFADSKPAGILFACPKDGERTALVRFVDRLDKPYCERTLFTSPAAAIDLAEPPQPGRTDARDEAGVADGDPLLAHLLLRSGDRSNSRWQRVRARWLLRRARQARRAGDLATAERRYARMLKLDPSRAREWVQYGHVLADRGEQLAAVAAYRMALHLEPLDPDPQFHLSRASRST